jgi:hypothetical protein
MTDATRAIDLFNAEIAHQHEESRAYWERNKNNPRIPVADVEDDTTVADVIVDMLTWLEQYSTSVSLAGAWVQVQEWRNALLRATQDHGCMHPGVFAQPDVDYMHCDQCNTDVPVAEL